MIAFPSAFAVMTPLPSLNNAISLILPIAPPISQSFLPVRMSYMFISLPPSYYMACSITSIPPPKIRWNLGSVVL